MEDIIELAAALLILVVAIWVVTAKFWRASQVVNRIVESNLLERLEALLARNELAIEDRDKEPKIKKAV